MKAIFKCTKNLVLGSQVIIMKHDIIKIIDQDFVEDRKNPDGVVTHYDIEVLISDMCEGLELNITIFDLAEHFEYLQYRTKPTVCWNDTETKL
jgi:hypothetical protein